MLFANISTAEKYDYLNARFKAAYKWLRETDLESMEVGKYPILGEEVFAQVQEYETILPSEGKWETHVDHFDIQYIVKGAEQFGVCKADGLKQNEPIPERDLYFYEEATSETGTVLLQEGDLIVVEPEEAHKPRLVTKEGKKWVKKVVVKVLV